MNEITFADEIKAELSKGGVVSAAEAVQQKLFSPKWQSENQANLPKLAAALAEYPEVAEQVWAGYHSQVSDHNQTKGDGDIACCCCSCRRGGGGGGR